MKLETSILASNPEYEQLLIQQEKMGIDFSKSREEIPEYISCKITLDINDIKLFYEYPKDKTKTIIWIDTGSFILDLSFKELLDLHKEINIEIRSV